MLPSFTLTLRGKWEYVKHVLKKSVFRFSPPLSFTCSILKEMNISGNSATNLLMIGLSHMNLLDTGCRWNICKTLRTRPGHLSNVLCTFKLLHASRRKIFSGRLFSFKVVLKKLCKRIFTTFYGAITPSGVRFNWYQVSFNKYNIYQECCAKNIKLPIHLSEICTN